MNEDDRYGGDDAYVECFYSVFTFHRFLQKSEHSVRELNAKEEIKSESERER